MVLIPVWIRVQGFHNFLWLSDIGLFGACLALWLENRLLASMMAVGTVLPDLAWTLLFLGRLLIDAGPLQQSGFMFDTDLPLFVRSLSLFHVLLPPLLVWTVYRLGYDRRGLLLQTVFTAPVLLISYWAVDAEHNVNFVYGIGEPPNSPLPQPWWFVSQLMILFFLAYLPTDFLLRWLSARSTWSRDGDAQPADTIPG